MTYKTVQGVLHPNGTLSLTADDMPDHSVPVMVAIMESDETESPVDLGDYLTTLTDYEERLARGEIKWQ
jgi:hypothetical protein